MQTAIEFYIRDLELRDRYGPGFVGTSDQRKNPKPAAEALLEDEGFVKALAEKLKEKKIDEEEKTS
jgi:hypothetical protein